MSNKKETAMTLQEFCEKYGLSGDCPKYEGSLDLRGTSITALPDNLTVGGYGNSQFAQFFAGVGNE